MGLPISRHLTVCVDDFGQHAGVNEAALALVAQGRVTAVSCLVDGPAWAQGASLLRQVAGQGAGRRADVGLHLNFSERLPTQAEPGPLWSARPVSRLILGSQLGLLDVALLRAEIERQWQAFEAHWGQAPDFIDGHQHAHQLPQIRDALWAVLDAQRARLAAGFWLRDCSGSVWGHWRAGLPLREAVKAGVISALGASAWRRGAVWRGLPTSSGLLGVYPFNTDAAGYLRLWRAWLKLVPASGGLMMCHPACAVAGGLSSSDAIAAARRTEFDVLGSPELGACLARAGVRITRMGQGPSC
jgi:chitin disaccharide deacetylase